MNPGRVSMLVAAIAAAPLSLSLMGVDVTLMWEPGMLLFVAALPWLIAMPAFGPAGVAAGFRAALTGGQEDRPLEEREFGASALREIGGLTLAIGAVLFLLELMGLLSVLSSTGGNANPLEVVRGLGSAMLGPIYGVLLKALVYDPLANAAEPSPGELASEL